jgi:hypothetical protein
LGFTQKTFESESTNKFTNGRFDLIGGKWYASNRIYYTDIND